VRRHGTHGVERLVSQTSQGTLIMKASAAASRKCPDALIARSAPRILRLRLSLSKRRANSPQSDRVELDDGLGKNE